MPEKEWGCAPNLTLPSGGYRAACVEPRRMSRLTKILVGIVLVSLPVIPLVLWIAERTQEQLPPNSRFEGSTSELVVLGLGLSIVLVLVVNLFELRRSRLPKSDLPSLD